MSFEFMSFYIEPCMRFVRVIATFPLKLAACTNIGADGVCHTKVLLYKGIIDKGIIHTKVLLDKGIVRN